MSPPLASAQHACCGLLLTVLSNAAGATPLQLFDKQRGLLYWAEASSGVVHVVGLRNTVSEYARLRPGGGSRVLALQLSQDGQRLRVQRSDGDEHYDTRSFRLLQRTPRPQAAPPLATAQR